MLTESQRLDISAALDDLSRLNESFDRNKAMRRLEGILFPGTPAAVVEDYPVPEVAGVVA